MSDWIGAKNTLVLDVTLQGIVGFAMTAAYPHLNQPSQFSGFVVIYGIFLALGEVGPGANIGLVSSKMASTPIHGHFYGVAAAWGKVGAFLGTWLFPLIIDAAGDDVVRRGQYPFWVSSALCIFSVFVAWFGLPVMGQDMIEEEDERFKTYLVSRGYNVSTLRDKAIEKE